MEEFQMANKNYAFFNEYGPVMDFSDATMVVAKNGAALHALIKSFEPEDPNEDMTQDECDFCMTAEEVSPRTQVPVGFWLGYKILMAREEYLQMPDFVAESVWKNYLSLLD